MIIIMIMLLLLLNNCNKDINNLLILNKGSDINVDLLIGAVYGDIKKVVESLKNGANINCRNEHNATALIHTSSRGHIEVAKLLIEKGANLNYQNDDGKTALIKT